MIQDDKTANSLQTRFFLLEERFKKLRNSSRTISILVEYEIEYNWDSGINGYIYISSSSKEIKKRLKSKEQDSFNEEIRTFLEDLDTFEKDGGKHNFC